ncbi:NlpC/p60-like transpeptidase [Longilinea arvoryzae]|uniref:NlpC/p60-like transpeptidase n=1 Tax=Longilinea arvoryzae TaxID=360412 RepID=A0A0S7BB46_9CHLR|nr:BtrH N-terminal domain-containing protein [Longilinea arvoryzae]GAP12413.1 NlpC/p60-like transpeptidase [Longilinea arvoryzae]
MIEHLPIPHRQRAGMCPVNGIRDLVQWRTGRDWSNEFVWGLGQGGGFAYLRFNAANPPRQVYTGNATPRQHRYLAELLGAGLTEIENRAFKFSWGKARQALDEGTPPILGPLDMFHLPYYSGIYHQRHIPIHFVLLVGYDHDTAYLRDTGEDDIQAVPLAELQLAWDVNSPGLGKRNRLAILELPQQLPSNAALIRKSITDECRMMLNPPVSMVGIPAMKKLAREIVHWPEELGEEVTADCLRQVREYLNTPPDLEGNHLTAGRDLYIEFLKEAGEMAGLDFSPAVGWLNESMAIVPGLAGAIRQADLEKAAACFDRFAEAETKAFLEMAKIVGVGS